MNSLILEDVGDLADLLVSKEPLLLVFTASFCGPSRVMQSVLDAFIENESFPITIVEVDVEKFPTITRQYEVKGTPELIMVWKAGPSSSRIGTLTYDQLVDYVEREVTTA